MVRFDTCLGVPVGVPAFAVRSTISVRSGEPVQGSRRGSLAATSDASLSLAERLFVSTGSVPSTL